MPGSGPPFDNMSLMIPLVLALPNKRWISLKKTQVPGECFYSSHKEQVFVNARHIRTQTFCSAYSPHQDKWYEQGVETSHIFHNFHELEWIWTMLTLSEPDQTSYFASPTHHDAQIHRTSGFKIIYKETYYQSNSIAVPMDARTFGKTFALHILTGLQGLHAGDSQVQLDTNIHVLVTSKTFWLDLALLSVALRQWGICSWLEPLMHMSWMLMAACTSSFTVCSALTSL